MGNGGFGSDLWKNVQAVKLGRHGGIEAPVRANSRQGIVLGQDAVAKSDAAEAIAAPATDRKARRRWSRQDAVAKSDAAEAIAAPATDRKARRRWSRLFRR